MNPVTALLLTLLIIASAAAQQQDTVFIEVTANPSDCVSRLEGAGPHIRGTQVVLKAKPTQNCVFMGWKIERGLPFSFTSSNPLVFYADENIAAVALFERIYETPGGEAIPRVLIHISTNVSLPAGLQPDPVLSRPGQSIRYVFPDEIPMGDKKYVFLFAEQDGFRHQTSDITIQAPERGIKNITAYYYTYIRFLDEFFPANQFVNVTDQPVKQVSDSERLVAHHYSVAGKTFPISQKIPRQMLDLAILQYTRQFKIVLASNIEDLVITVNDRPVRIRQTATQWIDEGALLTVSYPEKFNNHKVVAVNAYGLTAHSSFIVGEVKNPVVVFIEYKRIPNIEFLEIPVVGPIVFQVAETGTALTGLEGTPAAVLGLAVFTTVPAGAAVAAYAVKTLTKNRQGKAKEVSLTLQPFAAAEDAPTPEDLESSFRTKGRIIVPEHIAAYMPKKKDKPMIDGDEIRNKLAELFDRRDEEVSRLVQMLTSEDKVETTPYHLCHLSWNQRTLEIFKSKKVVVKGDIGYAYYEAEGYALSRLLEQNMAAVVHSPDLGLGVKIAVKACKDAGLKPYGPIRFHEIDIKAAAKFIKNLAKNADAAIIIPEPGEPEKTAIRSSALTKLRHVVVTDSPSITASVKIPAPTSQQYIGIAAAVLAQTQLLKHFTMESLNYLAEMAYSLRGLETIENTASMLEQQLGENPRSDVSTLLQQAFRQELFSVISPEELELVQEYSSVESLRNAYMSLMRQLKPGANPAKEWSRFLEKLRKLNMVVEP